MDILRQNSSENNTVNPQKAHKRLRSILKGMKLRCYNPNSISYPYYGAKGVKICAKWETSDNFISWALANGYEDTLLIDRIDTMRDYSPDNCRWVDAQTNSENRAHVTWVTAFGETKTVKAWTRDPRCQVDAHSLKMRLSRGYPPEISIQEPPCAYPSFVGPYEEGMPGKLTSERVRSIRCRYAEGGITVTQLAKEYGVGFSAVYKVVHQETWKAIQ